MMIEMILVAMWITGIRYGVQTLMGMKHRRLYPLIRLRHSDAAIPTPFTPAIALKP